MAGQVMFSGVGGRRTRVFFVAVLSLLAATRLVPAKFSC